MGVFFFLFLADVDSGAVVLGVSLDEIFGQYGTGVVMVLDWRPV